MNYYKRYWEESTGEILTDSWGKSNYYFETDSKMNVLRQIQIFENSFVLKYSEEFLEDEYGALANQELDKEEFADFKITKNEFELIWNNSNHFRKKKKWWNLR